MRIGFIGLGNMGGPMASNLCRKGFDVAVYDTVRERMAAPTMVTSISFRTISSPLQSRGSLT